MFADHGRVQYLYTIEHAVKNIAYHRFQSISVTLLSLVQRPTDTVHTATIKLDFYVSLDLAGSRYPGLDEGGGTPSWLRGGQQRFTPLYFRPVL